MLLQNVPPRSLSLSLPHHLSKSGHSSRKHPLPLNHHSTTTPIPPHLHKYTGLRAFFPPPFFYFFFKMVFENQRFLHSTADVSKAWAEQVNAERRIRRYNPSKASYFTPHSYPSQVHKGWNWQSQQPSAQDQVHPGTSLALPGMLPPAVCTPHDLSSTSSVVGGGGGGGGGGSSCDASSVASRRMNKEQQERKEVEAHLLNNKMRKVSSQMKDVQRELKQNSYENMKLMSVLKGLKRRVQALGTGGRSGDGEYGREERGGVGGNGVGDFSSFQSSLTATTATSFAPSQRDSRSRSTASRSQVSSGNPLKASSRR